MSIIYVFNVKSYERSFDTNYTYSRVGVHPTIDVPVSALLK